VEVNWSAFGQLFGIAFIAYVVLGSFGKGFVEGLFGSKSSISISSLIQPKFIATVLIASFFILGLYSFFSDRKFDSKEACFEFAKKAGNTNKAMAGVTACAGVFRPEKTEQTDLNRRFSQCFLNDFNYVKDDNTGTALSTKCAENTKNYAMGRFFARNYFSPVAKIEEVLDEQRRINTQPIFPTIQPSTELPDGPILFNKNGETITCIKIGVTINCD
jgi:uncharacterized membrane protein (DUF485 family)